MSLNEHEYQLYLQTLRADSQQVIDNVRQSIENGLHQFSYGKALDAYQNIIVGLDNIPEKLKEEIKKANDKYGSNSNVLGTKLSLIQQSIKREISTVTILINVIQAAQTAGADVSEMLQSIKRYSDAIELECNKLF